MNEFQNALTNINNKKILGLMEDCTEINHVDPSRYNYYTSLKIASSIQRDMV